MRKPLLFWLLTALLLFGIVEAMARLTHHWLYGESVADVDTSHAVPRNQIQKKKLWPFYGGTGQKRNLGMPPSSLNSRRHAATLDGHDAVVIGLFGGSVAAEVAGSLADVALKHFAGGSNDIPVWPVVIDLSVGGFRQPQQSLILTNLLAHGVQFDIVVSLDGLNEVAHETHDSHPSWPSWWSAAVGTNADQLLAVADIMALREEQQALTTPLVWQGSVLFDLARRYRLDQIDRLIVARHFDLATAGLERHSLQRQGPYGAFTREKARNVAAEAWYGSALLMAGLAERHGAAYYHFLQPNQYIPGAKTLSDDELANAYTPESLRARGVREGYPKLSEYGAVLRNQGVKFFDLSRIFADHPETLYVDRCCHLNRRGNDLLAGHMLRRLRDNGAFDARPVAAKRDNPIPSRYQAMRDSIVKGGFGAPAARSVFDVYRRGRTLAYLKRHCTVAHMTGSFFVKFMHRAERTGLRFHFTQHGAMLEGNTCVAIFELPDLEIGHLRTGQYWAAEEWSVKVDGAELNALDSLPRQRSATDFDSVTI